MAKAPNKQPHRLETPKLVQNQRQTDTHAYSAKAKPGFGRNVPSGTKTTDKRKPGTAKPIEKPDQPQPE